MTTVVSVHSFRGGTGKSNTTSNVAANLAALGHRVGVIDCDIQSPGIHVLFGFDETLDRTLNDYLWGTRAIGDVAHDITDQVAKSTPVSPGGSLHLVPSSMKPGDIARILRDGYDVESLSEGMRQLARDLDLDFLFVDTHPGLNEETLLSITLSDVLLLILRPDRQDYQGTAVTVDVARRLEVPSLFLVANKVPSGLTGLREQLRPTRLHSGLPGLAWQAAGFRTDPHLAVRWEMSTPVVKASQGVVDKIFRQCDPFRHAPHSSG